MIVALPEFKQNIIETLSFEFRYGDKSFLENDIVHLLALLMFKSTVNSQMTLVILAVNDGDSVLVFLIRS